MSRAYKQKLVDNINDFSGAGITAAGAEMLSGADLAQLLLSAEQGSTVSYNSTTGVKTDLGNNVQHSILATITADGVNTVTVDTTASLFVGQIIDVINSSGNLVSGLDDRTITAIDRATGVVTYNGADGTASVGNFVAKSARVNNATLSGADLERYSGVQ